MVTFRIIAVERFRIGTDSGLQVDHIQVGILMPDRESAITRQSTKHEPTIRRNSWKRNAFSIRTSIKQRIHLRTERSGFRVERDAAQAISQFSNGIRHQASRSSAIKQTLTIRRKRGKRIKT